MQSRTFLSVTTRPNLEVKRAVHPDKSLVSVSVLLRAKTFNEYECKHFTMFLLTRAAPFKVSESAETQLIDLEGCELN